MSTREIRDKDPVVYPHHLTDIYPTCTKKAPLKFDTLPVRPLHMMLGRLKSLFRMQPLLSNFRYSSSGLGVSIFTMVQGGRVWTYTDLGFPTDLGASWIHGASNRNPLTPFVTEFNLRTKDDPDEQNCRTSVWFDGGLFRALYIYISGWWGG